MRKRVRIIRLVARYLTLKVDIEMEVLAEAVKKIRPFIRPILEGARKNVYAKRGLA